MVRFNNEDQRVRARVETFAFHLFMIAFILATRLAYVPVRRLSADNGWHFQLAQDVVALRPIYWSAVDANRLFPDLLFSAVAAVLPGGDAFQAWVYWYYAAVFIATYLSLIALAAALYDNVGERRAFLLLSTGALWVIVLVTPFWGGWIFDPGNHGGALPVCILCLALAVSIWRSPGLAVWRLAAFVLLAALVVASNRFLLVAFLAPMLGALALTFLAQRPPAGGPRRGEAFLRPALVLFGAVIAAGALGYAGWRLEASLPWHQMMQEAELPQLPESAPFRWVLQRFAREGRQLVLGAGRNWELPFTMAFLLLAVPLGAVLLPLLARRRMASPAGRAGTAFFGLTVALSVVTSFLFIALVNSEEGDWHYRFFTIPVALTAVLFASLGARWRQLAAHPALSALVMAFLLIGWTQLDAAYRDHPNASGNAEFEKGLDDLATLLASRSSAQPFKGVSEYWLANDINMRTKRIQLEVAAHDSMELRFYNNNAGRFCQGGQFFVLRDANRDEPRKAAITARLGAPLSAETVSLGNAYPKVEVMFYDPALIEDRLLKPARDAAASRFPGFRCPASAPSPSARLAVP